MARSSKALSPWAWRRLGYGYEDGKVGRQRGQPPAEMTGGGEVGERRLRRNDE